MKPKALINKLISQCKKKQNKKAALDYHLHSRLANLILSSHQNNISRGREDLTDPNRRREINPAAIDLVL